LVVTKCIYLMIMMIIIVRAYYKKSGTFKSFEVAISTFYFFDVFNSERNKLCIDPRNPSIRFHRKVYYVALLLAGVLFICNLRCLLLQIRSIPIHSGTKTIRKHDDIPKGVLCYRSSRIHCVVWISIQK
jgi:hypothetical protein